MEDLRVYYYANNPPYFLGNRYQKIDQYDALSWCLQIHTGNLTVANDIFQLVEH